jgi:hypothetical protein
LDDSAVGAFDGQLPIEDFLRSTHSRDESNHQSAIGNWQSKIGNQADPRGKEVDEICAILVRTRDV